MTSFAYTQTSGNGVYINWYLSAWAPTQITDSDNRQVNINYSDSTCGGYTSISYLGAGGVTQVIKVITTSLSSALRSGSSAQTIDALFPGTTQPTSSNYNPTVASKVQLPDGSFYTFLYNSYGELARVVLRTGGAIEFDYGDANNNVNDGGGATGDGFVGNITDGNPVMIYRRLLARREYANGSTLSSTTTFAAASTGSGASEITTETDTVTDPVLGVLAQTKHWYNGIPTDALMSAEQAATPGMKGSSTKPFTEARASCGRCLTLWRPNPAALTIRNCRASRRQTTRAKYRASASPTTSTTM
jgi:hypothetical protein